MAKSSLKSSLIIMLSYEQSTHLLLVGANNFAQAKACSRPRCAGDTRMKSKPAILCRSRSPEPCIGSGDCPRRETHNTEPAPPSNRKSGSLKGARAANSRTHTRESPDFTVNVARGLTQQISVPATREQASSLVLWFYQQTGN